jgi:hypothetical protein
VKFERDTRPEPSAIRCAGCEKEGGRKWLHDEKWYCAPCLPSVRQLPPCGRCGAPTVQYGIDRFAIANSDSDRYSLTQGLGVVCSAGAPLRHVTFVAYQHGPGAENAGEELKP